jgi:hypothetical protein
VALLVQFLVEFTSVQKEPNAVHVEELLLACLMDDAANKKKRSTLRSWLVWIYQTQHGFKDPDRFQHACVHVKYAFKCAAFRKMQSNATADQDQKFAAKYFKSSICSFQQLEYFKRMARRCYSYVKPEKIRWLDHESLQVNTNGTSWIKLTTIQICSMILNQIKVAEEIFESMEIPIITSDELRTVKDTDHVKIGGGLWSMNSHLRIPPVKIRNNAEFLDLDSRIGTALGFAVCYSGGGSMRIPEVNEISYSRLTAGSVRSLRFRDGKLGGLCAITYGYTKMDSLMSVDAAASVEMTMKFAFQKLSCLLCTHAIRVKPQSISVAAKEIGPRAAMIHGAMMICQRGSRVSDASLRFKFNAILEETVPGLNVCSMRHVIEAVSFQAVETETFADICREDMRFTMISLSAHSARTSDGHYAGDQFQVAGIASHHVEKFLRAARTFNVFIGLELTAPKSGVYAEDTQCLAWKWTQEHRPEVAAAALEAVSFLCDRTTDPKKKPGPASSSIPLTPLAKSIRGSNPLGCPPDSKRMCVEGGQGTPDIRHDTKSQETTVTKYSGNANSLSQTENPAYSAASLFNRIDVPCSQARFASVACGNKTQPCPLQPHHDHITGGSFCSQGSQRQQGSQRPQLPSQGLPLYSPSDMQTGTLKALIRNQKTGRFLIVQPCSSGKSYYYTHFTRQPGTVVVLAQPFVSLMQQTASDAVTLNISTNISSGLPLKDLSTLQGLLVVTSYEKLHSYSNLAKQVLAEGLKLVVCLDELHVLLDSVEKDGYRTFQPMWTFMASLEPYDVLMFATSATVRPKFEQYLAQHIGIHAFTDVLRTSPARPEILLKKMLCSSQGEALQALAHENPQLILVMTKGVGTNIQKELKNMGKTSHFFHSGLTPSEKDQFRAVIREENSVIVATTGVRHQFKSSLLVMFYRFYNGYERTKLDKVGNLGIRLLV